MLCEQRLAQRLQALLVAGERRLQPFQRAERLVHGLVVIDEHARRALLLPRVEEAAAVRRPLLRRLEQRAEVQLELGAVGGEVLLTQLELALHLKPLLDEAVRLWLEVEDRIEASELRVEGGQGGFHALHVLVPHLLEVLDRGPVRLEGGDAVAQQLAVLAAHLPPEDRLQPLEAAAEGEVLEQLEQP